MTGKHHHHARLHHGSQHPLHAAILYPARLVPCIAASQAVQRKGSRPLESVLMMAGTLPLACHSAMGDVDGMLE